jgi:transmembrane sensor
MAEASWENGNINGHGRPLMDIIAALRPYRVGTLRVSAAAGGLPVFGHYSLDDTDATLSALQQRMPISIHYYGPFGVSIGVLPASIKTKNRSA